MFPRLTHLNSVGYGGLFNKARTNTTQLLGGDDKCLVSSRLSRRTIIKGPGGTLSLVVEGEVSINHDPKSNKCFHLFQTWVYPVQGINPLIRGTQNIYYKYWQFMKFIYYSKLNHLLLVSAGRCLLGK